MPVGDRAAGCPLFIDPNPGLAGYYHYVVSVEDLETARRSLAELAPTAKVGLLLNAWSTVRHLRLPPDALLKFLPSLDAEKAWPVIQRVAAILDGMRAFVADDSRRAFDGYVLERLGRHKANLGLLAPVWGAWAPDRDDSIATARTQLMWALGEAGDKDIVTRARASTRRWLEQNDASLEPELGIVALQTAAVHADASMLDAMTRRIDHPRAPSERRSLWSALGLVRDPALLRRALDTSLRVELDSRELGGLFGSAAWRPATRNILDAWLVEHWDALSAKWGRDVLWHVLDLLGRACDDEQRESLDDLLRGRVTANYLDPRRAAALRCRDARLYAEPAIARFFRSKAKVVEH